MSFFLETLVGGLLAGVMYSLVALSFVLIYKASRVFNFAQGSQLLLGALTFVTLTEYGLGFLLSGAITLVVLVLVALAIEATVLRPLAGQSDMTLFMATLGVSYVLEGGSQAVLGSDVHALDLGIPDVPMEIGPIQVSIFDMTAAGVSGVLVITLSLLFSSTPIGVSLRAVADDPLAAESVGIDLDHVWRVVWAVAGFVGLVAGLLWGSRQGIQFSLSLVVLKALPVLIIGGFTSISGAIVAGLLVGASEGLAELYLGPLIGGGLSAWFAYVLAVPFLLVRPAGLFGEAQIERV